MVKEQDIRWKQRFFKYRTALKKLNKYAFQKDLNELEKQGLIKSFEYTYELGWKTLQDYLRYIGYEDIAGPRPVIEQSFQDNLISDGTGWIKILKSRNLTSHTYDEITVIEIISDIKNYFIQIFNELENTLLTKEDI